MTGTKNVSSEIWLADLTYTQQTVAADVIPNAIGGIATFTEANNDIPAPIRLFKYPEKLIAAFEQGPKPRLVGFSNYVWNFSLSYAFASVIKKIAPTTVIVFGGPNYPTTPAEQQQFLRQNRAIDFYIIKEGELAFSRLIATLAASDWDIAAARDCLTPSIHTIGSNDEVHLAESIERIRNLSEIPSPYVMGRLDEFFDGVLLPIIQTNRGCPFSCTFCAEGVGYFNKLNHNSADKVAKELTYIGRKMQVVREKGGRNDLFIADSNFGMYKEDIDTCKEIAKSQKLYGWPEYINVATGKNMKERVLEAARIVNGAIRLSGSVQSLDPGVLENIKRKNINADDLMDLGMKAARVGANTYSEIILGLPGDSVAAHMATIRDVMDAGFTNIYLFQLMLLPGTELATPETKNRFGMVSRYRVLPRCYGNFVFKGHQISTAEIEEICVANATLSFDDYLRCRRFHLFVIIFHNDGIFGTIVKLLRMLGVSVFRWMELLDQSRLPDDLERLVNSFLEMTRNELWEDREALVQFTREPENVQKFINGELGNNLLFVYKTLAITRHLHALAAVAQEGVLQVLAESNQATEHAVTFVKEAIRYHVLRAEDLFFNLDEPLAEVFHFDIAAFEAADNPINIEDFEFGTRQELIFEHDDEQRAIMRRFLGIYGGTAVGIGRILSKIYLKKMFRHATPRGVETSSSDVSELDARYRIAGLQN